MDMNNSTGVTGHVGIVGNHYNGYSLLIEHFKEAQHFFTGFEIQIAGRLIRQENDRIIDQGPGNGDALLLPAGKLRRLMIQTVAQAHLNKQFPGKPIPFLARNFAGIIRQRHDHIVQGAGARQQIKGLEDKAKFLVTQVSQGVGGQDGDILTIQPEFSGGGTVEASQDIQESGFAGAGGAHKGDKFSLMDFKGDVFEDRHLNLAQMIAFFDILEFYEFQ